MTKIIRVRQGVAVRFNFTSLMSKAEVNRTRKLSLKRHRDVTLRGARLKKEPVLFWVRI